VKPEVAGKPSYNTVTLDEPTGARPEPRPVSMRGRVAPEGSYVRTLYRFHVPEGQPVNPWTVAHDKVASAIGGWLDMIDGLAADTLYDFRVEHYSDPTQHDEVLSVRTI